MPERGPMEGPWRQMGGTVNYWQTCTCNPSDAIAYTSVEISAWWTSFGGTGARLLNGRGPRPPGPLRTAHCYLPSHRALPSFGSMKFFILLDGRGTWVHEWTTCPESIHSHAPSGSRSMSDVYLSVWRLSGVCLSVAYIGPNSRTERSRKTKIVTEVTHVARDSDTTFKVKRSKVKLLLMS